MRRRLLIIAALVGLGVLVAFLAKEGRNNADQWMSIIGGFVGVAGAVGAAIDKWGVPKGKLLVPDADAALRRCLLFVNSKGLPLVRDVLAQDVGVKAAIVSIECNDGSLPTYVPRVGDDDLEWAIASGGVVLVHGRAAAGKTRSAFEAIRRLRPNHCLLVPASGPALRELVDDGFEPRDSVVWLDDLERYLVPGGVDQNLIERLCSDRRHDVLVVATLRGEELERLDQAARSGRGTDALNALDIDWPGVQVVQHIRGRRRVHVGQFLTETEKSAAAVSSDQRVVEAANSNVGFAEYLAAGPPMMQRWSFDGDDVADVGQALITAAVDCRRAGYPYAVPANVLAQLFRHYLNPARSNRADLPSLRRGLEWASEPLLGASSCLIPQDGDCYAASDYLLDRTEAGEGPLARRDVGEAVWTTLLTFDEPYARYSIATAAYFASRSDVAETAIRPLANDGYTEAMLNLGLLLHKRNQPEAEYWYRQAADAGATFAMVRIGILSEEANRLNDAESWYRRAVEAGERHALPVLGWLREKRGDVREAEHLYRLAVEDGDVDATAMLGALLEKQGNAPEAERLYRLAGGSGHVRAMVALGLLLERTGSAEAEQWYRTAVERGSARAMIMLGILRGKHGATDEANTLYRRAFDEGETHAAVALGISFEKQESVDEAENWYRRGAGTGNELASLMLALLLERRGLDGEAERWYEKVARGGDGNAMVMLANLLAKRGEVEQAHAWYHSAVELGNTQAMIKLAAQNEAAGSSEEAKLWLQRAANAGDTHAMVLLGMSLEHDDRAESERWYRAAADAGENHALLLLAVVLDRRGEADEAEYWYRRSAETGDAHAAALLADTLAGQGELDEANSLRRLAANSDNTRSHGPVRRTAAPPE
ncbi:tetratricopeptide repeat protein [Phytohabitans kaempferiae]|uniref:Tetratricopeptide repeat protein n=1 Tax=Phytohabitans kaempferiae TaxID=1620943 RepID=A0ABV6M8R5_9ACTN